MALLQEQIREILSELKTVKADFVSYRAMAEERHTQDEIEKDDLRSQLAAARRLNAMYESPHNPTSTNSAYNHRRSEFRRKQAEAETAEKGTDAQAVPARSDGGAEPDTDAPANKRRGVSHSNRPDKFLLFETKKCGTCGSTSLQRKHVYRQMYDFDGDRMRDAALRAFHMVFSDVLKWNIDSNSYDMVLSVILR